MLHGTRTTRSCSHGGKVRHYDKKHKTVPNAGRYMWQLTNTNERHFPGRIIRLWASTSLKKKEKFRTGIFLFLFTPFQKQVNCQDDSKSTRNQLCLPVLSHRAKLQTARQNCWAIGRTRDQPRNNTSWIYEQLRSVIADQWPRKQKQQKRLLSYKNLGTIKQ